MIIYIFVPIYSFDARFYVNMGVTVKSSMSSPVLRRLTKTSCSILSICYHRNFTQSSASSDEAINSNKCSTDSNDPLRTIMLISGNQILFLSW